MRPCGSESGYSTHRAVHTLCARCGPPAFTPLRGPLSVDMCRLCWWELFTGPCCYDWGSGGTKCPTLHLELHSSSWVGHLCRVHGSSRWDLVSGLRHALGNWSWQRCCCCRLGGTLSVSCRVRWLRRRFQHWPRGITPWFCGCPGR